MFGLPGISVPGTPVRIVLKIGVGAAVDPVPGRQIAATIALGVDAVAHAAAAAVDVLSLLDRGSVALERVVARLLALLRLDGNTGQGHEGEHTDCDREPNPSRTSDHEALRVKVTAYCGRSEPKAQADCGLTD